MATLSRQGVGLARSGQVRTRTLLACGIAAPVVWVIANEVAAATYPGYDRLSQAISELSATYAASRPFLVPVLVVYQGMVVAFGVGVWRAGRQKRALRITSGLLTVGALIGLVAFAFPLTRPPATALVGAGLPFSDTMHNILAGGVATVLMLLTYGFGAASLGRRFRVYSIGTAAAEIIGGGLMFLFASGVVGGDAAHWVGAAERVVAWVWELWVAVLAVALLRRHTV